MAKKSKAITIAAQSAGAVRFASVEREATKIHQQETGARFMRAVSGEQGLHVLFSDGGTTVEVAGGKFAVSVRQGD